MNRKWMSFFLMMVVTTAICGSGCSNKMCKTNKIDEVVKKLGHRNWIVVTDSAYPWQNSAGIETIVVNCEQEKQVQVVLESIRKAGHVRPTVYLDQELGYVSEKNAPGISDYRNRLDEVLKGYPVVRLKHEELIAKLDASSKIFKVIILKTNMKLPYTSVFMELGCGYWTDAAEKELRANF